ncbi:MerR family transcriptional regulator [Saccharopolyspora gloriosae]|uniref:MerR family transcriptional regulator n=1 Tax=Saccharopolyspora gloriosae TaxID=455344 RepID=UPI001FB817B9|nr:MerR family transcriptional regulator [Saccharopolyspora gloriosae]
MAAALGEPTATAPAASAESTLTIGALAHRIGLRPATLRKWERAGILRPHRDPATGYRIYPPGVVRDAHLAHQLRRGGHPLSRIAEVVARIRDADGVEPLQEALRDRRDRLRHRSRAMLDGAAELGVYLRPADDRPARARIPEND